MSHKPPRIKHVSWRDGRPRFQPSRTLREAGHAGRDLRHEDGTWYTAGEALDWSNAFVRQLAAEVTRNAATAAGASATARRASSPAPSGAQAAGRSGVRTHTVATMILAWQNSPRWTDGTRRGLSPATKRDYRQKLRIVEDDHPLIWNAPAHTLKRPILRAMYEEIWQARGIASARGAIAVLSSAYSWAILAGRVKRDDNPALKLSMETPDPRVRFFSRAEFQAWVAAADAIGRPEIGDMAYLGVWTGQRQADRLALMTQAKIGERRVFRQQKTGAIVWAMKSPELERRLEAAEKRRAAARATALLAAKTPQERAEVEARFAHVILDERRWVPFKSYHYSHLCAEVREAAAKTTSTLADIHEADLRDTAVTWMALAGATVPEIVAVTGHTMESATRILRHYLARHPEMADSAIGKMVAWYQAGGETEIGL